MSHQSFDHYYIVPLPVVDYNTNEIKTLFISGLPEDVKAREIHNLFRHRPGFEACQLKYTGRGDQVVAFAVFYNHQSAIAAKHALHGVKFDPQTGSALHIELARTNSWRARKAGDGPYVVIDNRKRISANVTEQEKSSSSESDDDDAETYDSANKDDEENNKSEEARSDGDAAAVNEEKVTTEAKGGERSRSFQACSTLFIANLGPKCSEEELKQVLSKYPGFNVLKLRARSGMPVAFADFEEEEQASKAMEELEGSVLESSDRGGMHIEYARSKMRKP